MANTIEGYGSQFFADQQVHATDLNNIQYTSLQGFRNYLKNITKTPGVYLNQPGDNNTSNITGLHVSCNNAGTLLTIREGIGVDPVGRLLHIPAEPTVASGSLGADPLFYPARPSATLFDPSVAGAGTYFVNLYYIPLYGSEEPDDTGNKFFTRVYDSYRIAVEATRATSTGLTLARGVFNTSGSLTTTLDEAGYVAGSGTQYALFDERVGYEAFDEQKGDNAVEITKIKTAIFEEELEKSVGFVFPAPGHSIVTKIHRNATIVRLELYMELQDETTGQGEFSFFSGSVANDWKTGPLVLSTTTPDRFVIGSLLNLQYEANNPIKVELSKADDTVTRATATIVYKRR